jgi:hypothetical protein
MTAFNFEVEQNSQNEYSAVPALTNHALNRMKQRRFSQLELNYVVEHGRLLRRTGICFYFLAAKDVPMMDRKFAWVQRLIGTTVLASADQAAVITLYKNQKALRDIRKKTKFRA